MTPFFRRSLAPLLLLLCLLPLGTLPALMAQSTGNQGISPQSVSAAPSVTFTPRPVVIPGFGNSGFGNSGFGNSGFGNSGFGAGASLGAQVYQVEIQNALLHGQIAVLAGQNAALQTQITGLNTKITSLAGAANAPPTVFGQAFVPKTGAPFFLHWQTSCGGYGQVPWQVAGSVDGYVKAITEAKAFGCDGFALDTGGNDANYLASLANMYAAANQVNAAAGWANGLTGTYNGAGVGKFSLYVKFDFSNAGLENTAAIVSMLTPLLHDPANWTIGGRPVYATYVGGGGRSWASLAAIFQPANAQLTQNGIKPFLVWGGEQTSSDGSGSDGSVLSTAAWLTGCVKPFADGVWQFPGPTPPTGPVSAVPGAEQLATACKNAGVAFLASVIPAYGQTNNTAVRYLQNFSGGEGINAQMRSITDFVQPQLGSLFLGIEAVGANDLGELSEFLAGGPYMPGGSAADPAQGVWIGYPHSGQSDWYQPKLGLQADTLYSIQKMKTGQVPLLTSDRLCAYQLTCLQNALESPSADPLGPIYSENDDTGSTNPQSSKDYVYVTCYLAQSGYVRLTQDGGYSVVRFAPAGQSFLRLPCQAGSVKVTLERSGGAVLTMIGHSIAATSTVANPNIFTMTTTNAPATTNTSPKTSRTFYSQPRHLAKAI